MKPAQKKRIEKAFTYHPPKDDFQQQRYSLIRQRHGELATMLAEICPDSRELNSSLKCLEESQAWSIAAIARNE